MTLRRHQPSGLEQDDGLAGDIHRQQLGNVRRPLLERTLITEDTECRYDEVDVGRPERAAYGPSAGLGVAGVEGVGADDELVRQGQRGCREGRTLASGQHHLGPRRESHRPDDREADLARAAHEQDALHPAGAVAHQVSPSLRLRSEANTPRGSSSSRTARHPARSPYIRSSWSRPSRASLAR